MVKSKLISLVALQPIKFVVCVVCMCVYLYAHVTVCLSI